MFSYFGIGINFFLLLLLATKQHKTLADKILLSWLLVIGCHLILHTMNLQPATLHNIHWLMGTGIPFPLLHGPFLYLYTAAMTNLLPANRKLLFLHFVPALVAILFFLPVYTMTASEKLAFMHSGARGYKNANLFRIILTQVSGLVYVIWNLLLLKKHKQHISREFSYEEKINLNWLRYFIYGLGLIWIIIVFMGQDKYIFNGVVLFIIFLGYFGIRQGGIFISPHNPLPPIPATEHRLPITETLSQTPETLLHIPEPRLHISETRSQTSETRLHPPEPEAPDLEPALETPKKKYANSGISDERAMALHQQLLQLIATEKPYTDPELSLTMLAEQLAVHPNYLSQVINDKEGKTFSEMINILRVEEFKRLVTIPENRQFTIMSLAYDCGFNSKSSFNKNFRKVTGQSPTEYLNKLDLPPSSMA